MASVQEKWKVPRDQEGEIDGGVSAGKPVATPDDRVTSPSPEVAKKRTATDWSNSA